MTTRTGLRQVAGKGVVCSECGRKCKRTPAYVKGFHIKGEQWWCYDEATGKAHCGDCCSCPRWGSTT